MSEKSESTTNKLVTIICRSIGRPDLKSALDSISAQSYKPIEVILINSSEKRLENFLPLNLQVTVLDQPTPLSRADAANAGIDAAKGGLLLFLDDDDYISNDHISNLASKMCSDSSIRAVYSGTQKVTNDGKLLGQVYSTEFDPILLMRDNYIPIHSMLFEKSLIDEGCRFDPQFEIYEDWDFWLQLAQKTKFLHVPNVTAYYRSGGESGTALSDESKKYDPESKISKARAQIFKKWKTQWTGQHINMLIGKSYNELNELSEHCDNLNEQLSLIEEQRKVLGVEQKKLRREAIILSHSLNESLTHIAELKSELEKTVETEKNLRLHESQLEDALREILSSRSWKMTSPLRQAVIFIKNIFGIFNSYKAKTHTEKLHIEAKSIRFSKNRKSPTNKEVHQTETPTHLENLKSKYGEKARKEFDILLRSSERLAFPESSKVNLSIIIVLYNQAHLSLLCLKSILQYADVEYEVVIIDNASTDRTEDLLLRVDNAKVIRNKENLGFLKAVNQGSKISKGKYTLLLNNDAMLKKGALSRAIHTIEKGKNIGAVGGKIELIDGTLQEAGNIIWNDGSCIGYGRGEDPNDPKFMFKRQVDYCSGAFLLFRKTDFEKLNGFDTSFSPAYYEETDFCIRLHKSGLKTIYDPNVVIVHYEFASSENIAEALSLQEMNRRTLRVKHKEWLAKKYAPNNGHIQIARSANNHKNILLIDDRVPHPVLGSGYPRCANILNTLAKLDFNITLYPLQFPSDDWGACYETLDDSIEVILEKGQLGLREFLKTRNGFFQHIIISRVHNMEVFEVIVKNEEQFLDNVQIIYDAEALTSSREILQASFLGQGISNEKQAVMMKNEVDKCAIADSVIAVSEQEAEVYKRHGIESVHVLGHMMTANPGNNSFKNREGLLFVGALRDEGSPNVDSLLWFFVNVLPLIEKHIPDITVYVVGELGAPSLSTAKKENINFLGKIKDLNDIYNQCKVFIAPTRFAAGIPHKVHEAAANGIPCVTTELLAKQLNWTGGEELLIGNSPDEFSSQCLRLYSDQKLWEDIRQRGLSVSANDCSETNFQKQLKSILN
jgi:GT2 family glycosyltransferase